MTALELINLIKEQDYDIIHLLPLRPITKNAEDACIIDILVEKSDELLFKISIKYLNNEWIVDKHNDIWTTDENLGKMSTYNVIYFIILCAQLPNCVI